MWIKITKKFLISQVKSLRIFKVFFLRRTENFISRLTLTIFYSIFKISMAAQKVFSLCLEEVGCAAYKVFSLCPEEIYAASSLFSREEWGSSTAMCLGLHQRCTLYPWASPQSEALDYFVLWFFRENSM